jgi:MFS family permease
MFLFGSGGKMATKISEEDVRMRLASYTDASVTNELYSFGTMLLDDGVDRLGKSDTKASAIAGYAGALIAVLASTAGIWRTHTHSWHLLFPVAAIIALFLAALFAVSSTTLKRTEWFSTNEWIKADCLSDAERLRRYHILTMWGARESLEKSYKKKLADVRKAELATLIAWILLAISFFQVAASPTPF